MQYSFKSIFNEVKKFKKELIVANIVAIIAVIISTPIPLLIPLLVDEILLDKPNIILGTIDIFFDKSEPYFYVFIVLIVVLVGRALFFTLNVLQLKLFTIISKNITFKIRKDLLTHLGLTSLSELESIGNGKISSILVIDINTIDEFLSSVISKLIISILTIIGVAIVLLSIHWQLGLFIFLINPFVIILTTKIARKVGMLKKIENSKIALFQEALSETMEIFWQIRASNQDKKMLSKITEKAKDIKDASIAFGYKSEAAAKLSALTFISGFEVFRATSILAVAYSDLSIGLMLAIFGYLWVIMTPFQDIFAIQYTYANAKSALARVNELFALENEPKYNTHKNPFAKSVTNEIELKNVDFSYHDHKTILKNISLKIPKGKKVAIVGASGSGKTTLAHIIVGFYPISRGEILYDNIDIKEIGLDVVRENIYLVLQNPQLINTTIEDNLTFGRDCTPQQIKDAITLAQLDSFINDLKDGIKTKVGKNGIKLSGGQRQRLSIARMILQNPRVVILDESTSALDMHTEKSLFEALQNFLKDKTTIIIAHRLETIKNSDYIYVLNNGTVEEEGTFEQISFKELN